MPGLSDEIKFKTARSGGKGGQNVNKVETMVEGVWHVQSSALYSDEEKELISEKLKNRINTDGYLQVKSQEHRSQLENKLTVVRKMEGLIAQSLKKDKPRKPTRPTKASKVKRIESKLRAAVIKQDRKKIRYED